MDLIQIIYVLEAAQCGSLSRASERLFTSQPAMSQRIKSLEQELGYALFYRTPKGVRLTASGEIFCREAQPVVESWQQLSQWVSENSHTMQKHLRLGLGVRAYSSGLFEDVVHFFDLHPDIEVTFVTEAGRDFLPDLKEGALDLVLDRLPPDEFLSDQSGLVTHDLICEKQCVLMSWNNPLSGLESISVSQLQNCTMISALENSLEDKTLKSVCSKSGITLKRLYRSDNIDMIMELVRKGKGVTIGPQSFANYYGVSSTVLEPETNVYLKSIYLGKNGKRKEIVQFQCYLEKVCRKYNYNEVSF